MLLSHSHILPDFGAAEYLEVRSEGLSLVEGVGQVLPEGLRQEERDRPSDDGQRAHYHQRQHVAVFSLESIWAPTLYRVRQNRFS